METTQHPATTVKLPACATLSYARAVGSALQYGPSPAASKAIARYWGASSVETLAGHELTVLATGGRVPLGALADDVEDVVGLYEVMGMDAQALRSVVAWAEAHATGPAL
ncbi:MAG: hypothetical protein ACRCSN_04825 [Dermatophilaceae bacterium]